ncbi:MAG TPA: Mut7-C RNAse domain-containing protein [Flavisolibacter sp.]|nr:Mut7-C RNAse domain-containing protein [Flavisolibacter sp.]
MDEQTEFNFHGSLNDFLRQRERLKPVSYAFHWNPSVKDAIEAIGIPHVEVGLIEIDQSKSNFSYLLKGNEHIDVYPYNNSIANNGSFPDKFILDVHLGKLARILRLFGIDVVYDQYYDDHEIIQRSVKEDRNVLTRDIGLLKHKILKYGYWLRSQDPEQQAVEVIKYYKLQDQFHPFSRCIVCNHSIIKVPKEKIILMIPDEAALYYQSFYQCTGCHKIYWKGSHFDHMLEIIERIKTKVTPGM